MQSGENGDVIVDNDTSVIGNEVNYGNNTTGNVRSGQESPAIDAQTESNSTRDHEETEESFVARNDGIDGGRRLISLKREHDGTVLMCLNFKNSSEICRYKKYF